MYLHIVTDSIYTETFIENNEKFNKDCIYLLLTKSNKLKFVMNRKNLILKIIPNTKDLIKYLFFCKDCISLINKSCAVYFHNLHRHDCIILLLINKKLNKKLYWLVWGSDLYMKIKYSIYDNYSKTYVKYSIKEKLFAFFFRIVEKLAIKKITKIGTIIDGDYQLAVRNFHKNFERLNFFYVNPLSFELYSKLKKTEKVSTILVGNSGDPSNNHFSILKFLPSDKNFKIICPLSYGDKNYISNLIQFGIEKFGENFVPLTSFLDKSEYLKLLADVDVSIMNHYRQQALGNIFSLLALGKVVYINSLSTVYDFLLSKGIFVYDTQQLLSGKSSIMDMLDYEQLVKNKEVIMDINSKEKSLKYIENLYV